MTSPAPGRPSVILVDDDPAVAHAVQFSFDLEGLGVSCFRDGESLLGSQWLPLADCLILDHKLPGMDGLTLLGRLRSRGAQFPAILVTSNPRAALRERAAAAGVLIVEKPLLTDALLCAVRGAIGISDVS